MLPLFAASLGGHVAAAPTVLVAQTPTQPLTWMLLGVAALVALFLLWATTRYIPNNAAAVVELLWSPRGSVPQGRIIALDGEAGFQAELLRGGLHFGYWRWQYRLHKIRLVTIAQGKLGYVYARDGEPLPPGQTLARGVPCNNFEDARAFLSPLERNGQPALRGQRGRQRAVLREGVYAINLAQFVVMTEGRVFSLRALEDKYEAQSIARWHEELVAGDGFNPVVVGGLLPAIDPLNPDETTEVDGIGIVTVHDGPSLAPGEIIAPAVGNSPGEANYHNNYQDPEAFLRAGGRRGRQYVPLTDGTYFINRWFASVELIPKKVVPIGYVGVVVSYYGQAGRDLSGAAFRHGEQVAEGERGVWERSLGPGKYAFNTYAGNVVLVPTTNFVLHWITGRTESHRYDESLRSIDLVTKDAYEPLLPLSVVVHIDYQRAPSVIQRFGDVKKLITQTLDPLLSAYFRDVAHRQTMLELLHERDKIQTEARETLKRRFREFDIECVDVLIGKPVTEEADGKIETLLEQLRLRQLSIEQIETYQRQQAAAEKQRSLAEAQAQANMQTQLTNAALQVQISQSQGEADLAKARRQAEQTVVLAEADAKSRTLAGRGEGQRVLQVGLSQVAVLLRRIAAYGDPRLYAVNALAEQLAHSTQPLVPDRLFVAGGPGGDGASTLPGSASSGLVGLLVNLLVAEKAGFTTSPEAAADLADLKAFAKRMETQTLEAVDAGAEAAEK